MLPEKGTPEYLLTICTRPVSASECTSIQSAQYNTRVNIDNSVSDDYSIRISRVLLNESGTYECTSQFPDTTFDKFDNVRIISKYQLYILLVIDKLSSEHTSAILLLYLTN